MTTLINAAALEASVKNFTRELREIYKDRDIGGLRFQVDVLGRTHGDLKIEFSVSESIYDANKATSGNVQAAVDEFFRRKGWTDTNTPLCLTYDEPMAAE